jgi:hypothetical protein
MKVVEPLSIVVGLVTGLIALAGLIDSESSIAVAGLVAGIAYIVFLPFILIFWLHALGALKVDVHRWPPLKAGAPPRWPLWFFGGAGLLGVVGGIVAIVNWDKEALYGFGVLGLALVTVFAVLYAIQSYQDAKGGRKQCTDCIEMVNVRARVCPYCRHRFESEQEEKVIAHAEVAGLG